MLEFNTDKEVFDYVRKYDISNISPLIQIFSPYSFNNIIIEDLLSSLHTENYLLIDVRSEKEYEETNIPTSINFPVLDNKERHFTGTVYKNYSDLAATKLAEEFAQNKLDSLNDFLVKNNAKDKNIIVYCWRGGGRSKYLSKMIFDLGYNPNTLLGGIKSYRKYVNNFFETNKFPKELLEINGLTGCGKTEILCAVKDTIPVMNIEESARHFSSLFGFVPYKIRGYNPVINQSAFENNIFGNFVYNNNNFTEFNTYLVESESKKVGDFYIPRILYNAINKAKTIRIETSFENRVSRLQKDYFPNEEGFNEMLKIFTTKEKFFRKELSNVIYEYCLNAIESGNSHDFIFTMLSEYYDKKYKDKAKKPIAVINTDEMESAVKEIICLYNKLI